MANNNENFINDQISAQVQGLMPETLKRAYRAADMLSKETPFLQTPTAKANKGRLYSWAVDFAIEQVIKNGAWDCDYHWSQYAKPTGRYLEVRLPHSRLSISRVQMAKKQPRDVHFRTNMRMNNQLTLLEEMKEEHAVQGLPHILLTHGGSDPDFAYLGIPNADHSKGYLYQTGNLMLRPHIIVDDRAPIEDTDYEDDDLMDLKEEIEKWLKDNDV
ncbi:MAG: hypothetical protein JKY45_04100 [Emcibacter sp.]|nr:hypothetical protein [Emcibacter sp.]